MNPLGRLEKVDLREVWVSEAGDFTPWLASEENIALLGDVIGLDLEVEAQEKEVGPFRVRHPLPRHRERHLGAHRKPVGAHRPHPPGGSSSPTPRDSTP